MEVKNKVVLKINQLLDDASHISECGQLSKVVDVFEKEYPAEKEITKDFRNVLCDITFELYSKRYV